jgi:hypothetical protein
MILKRITQSTKVKGTLSNNFSLWSDRDGDLVLKPFYNVLLGG